MYIVPYPCRAFLVCFSTAFFEKVLRTGGMVRKYCRTASTYSAVHSRPVPPADPCRQRASGVGDTKLPEIIHRSYMVRNDFQRLKDVRSMYDFREVGDTLVQGEIRNSGYGTTRRVFQSNLGCMCTASVRPVRVAQRQKAR